MKKKCLKFLDVLTEFDLFAPNITVRYQSDNDFKTLTGAILSFALIVFFGVIFVNRFTVMLNRTEITASVLKQEELDPRYYNTSTPNFLFAIGLTNVDMNTGNRYFGVSVVMTKVINGTKSKVNLLMGPCKYDEWLQLGEHFGYLYNKLQFQKWLCPQPGQVIQLQGKFSSDVFKYVKIGLSNCTGTTVNGQPCHTPAAVASFLSTNEVFAFNFYFINTLINPEQQQPVSIFLDDTNNFPFSTTTGTSCNFFMQGYTINTDNSLLPFDEISTVTGGLANAPALMTSYQASQNEFLRFYIRKSPASELYTRTFFKFDDLLSYVGGLFGLIAMVIQLPLTYYNTCCFELSLATDLFVYKKNKKQLKNSKENDKQLDNTTPGSSLELMSKTNHTRELKVEPLHPKTDRVEETTKESESEDLLHSVDSFNFFVYLGYIPFFILKRFGWKKLHSKKFTPYYEAIRQVRRQIDIGILIQRMIYFERSNKAVLDEDQRKLMYVYPKENIYQLEEHRKGTKLRDKLKEAISRRSAQEILSAILPDILPEAGDDMPNDIDQLRKAYYRTKNRSDRTSQQILRSLDSEFTKHFPERDDTETKSPQKRMEKEEEDHGFRQNRIANQSNNNEETVVDSRQKFIPVNFEFIDLEESPRPRRSARPG